MGHRISGYERIPNNLYETPAWVTRSLLKTYPILPYVWEPACGNGKMVKTLLEYGHKVTGSDVIDYGTGHEVCDFLQPAPALRYAGISGTFAIVTNPPYGPYADPFIRNALELTEEGLGQVAMLLPTDFDHAVDRRDLFDKGGFACLNSFAAKIMLPHRIKWIEGSKGGPTHNHCWYVWDWRHIGPALALYAPVTPLEERK